MTNLCQTDEYCDSLSSRRSPKYICLQYNIEKPATEEDEEDDEDDFAFGPKKLEDNQDSISSENCYFAKAILLYIMHCVLHASIYFHYPS